MIKSLVVAGAVAAVALSAPMAGAADGVNCSDVGHSVDTSAGDPYNLDADNDGVGCEGEPGAPVPLDEGEKLADTGASDVVNRHPLRAYGAAGLTVAVGAATVIVVRRRTRLEGE